MWIDVGEKMMGALRESETSAALPWESHPNVEVLDFVLNFQENGILPQRAPRWKLVARGTHCTHLTLPTLGRNFFFFLSATTQVHYVAWHQAVRACAHRTHLDDRWNRTEQFPEHNFFDPT